MLYGTADTTGDVYLGAYGHTGLANLKIVFTESSIHCCAAGTYFAMKFLGKFTKKVKSFFRTHTITASNHDRCSLKIVLGFFYMTFKHPYHKVGFVDIAANVFIYDLTLVLRVEHFGFHHT